MPLTVTSKHRPTNYARLSMAHLAARIHGYLRQFENDPRINRPRPEAGGMRTYFRAGAFGRGAHVRIIYLAHLGAHVLTKPQAIAYLTALDGGFVGRHTDMPAARRARRRRSA